MSQSKKKSVSSPFTLIFILIIIVYILSFLIPSGEYVRTSGVIDPASFHYTQKTFLSPLAIINGFPKLAYAAMGKLFITMMITAGAIQVAQDSKAMDLGVYDLVKHLQDKAIFMIPLLVAFTGFLGMASVMLSTAIAFIPLGITIARRLGIDNIFPVGLMFLGSFTGFMASPISPVTTALAQEIAGLPILSGFGFRMSVTAILLAITAAYLTWYAYRVRKDAKNSVMSEITLDSFGKLEDLSHTSFTWRHGLVLLVFMLAFVLFAVGSKNWGFGVSELSSIMLPTAFLMGFIARMSVPQICACIIKGMQGMANPILFMLIATCITVILKGSHILDTIVYFVSIPLTQLGEMAAAVGMFVANALINLGISSGSGQAVVVMPIMAPLADVVGVSRQVAVLAYQLGDGFTNLLNPVNVILLGSLALVRASFLDWLKFILPLYGAILLVCVVSLAIAVGIGWQ